MKSDKIISMLYMIAGMLYLVNAMINKGSTYIALGSLFFILGIRKHKEYKSKLKDSEHK